MSLRCGLVLSALSVVLALGGCASSFGTGGASGDDGGGDDGGVVQGSGSGGNDSSAPPLDGGHPSDATTGTHDSASDANDAATSQDTGGPLVDSGAPDSPAETGPTCPSEDLQCSGGCVPNDVHNCGTCGNDCTNLPHVFGTTSCTAAGACSFPPSACAAGWADCNGNPDDGCEQGVTDQLHCGTCTNVCPPTAPQCAGGACVTGCPSATPDLCGSTCVDEQTDPSHCSGCSTVCPAGPSGSQPVCAGGGCSFTCNSGLTGCPTAAPTACVNETDDANNCGSCGHVCPGPLTGNGTASCSSSSCSIVCNGGFALCGGTTCVAQADTTNGAFVSPSGNDASNCSAAQPCLTIGKALTVNKPKVYVDTGTYAEQISLAANVTIYGGWTFDAASGTWNDCGGSTTVITTPGGLTPSAAIVTGTSGTWTLDDVTVKNATTASAGQTLYGVFVKGGTLTLNGVAVSVAAGGAGTDVTSTGSPGNPAIAAPGCGSGDGATGPAGGSGNPGAGSYSASGYQSVPGGPGIAGNKGDDGTTAPAVPACVQTNGPCQARCQNNPTCTLWACDCLGGEQSCGTAGSNGCGGGGGGGGAGGNGGGSSIGVFLAAGTVSFSGCTVQTGNGGNGGSAGSGGAGASGSAGAAGNAGPVIMDKCQEAVKQGATWVCADCTTESAGAAGAAGGTGGTGGTGGAGGGGAGGDSYCYATPAGGAPPAGMACTPGSAGVPGDNTQSNSGTTGHSGAHN